MINRSHLKRYTDWRWFGLSFALPTAVVLGWQFGVALDTERGGVILAPLYVIGLRSPTDLVTLGYTLPPHAAAAPLRWA